MRHISWQSIGGYVSDDMLHFLDDTSRSAISGR